MARITKRNFAFRGLVKCHRCGCSMTPDMKMGKYTYYRCTEWKGKCKNSISEPELADRLADVVRDIQITPEVADGLRVALHKSHKDRIEFHQQAQEALERRHKATVSRMDRAYDDKLSGKISGEFWQRKSATWEDELIDIRLKVKAHESANLNYFQIGSEILELASSAYCLFLEQDRQEQRQLLDTLLSNCTFYHGTLCPTYNKPFDILAKGTGMQLKRGGRYEFRNWVIANSAA